MSTEEEQKLNAQQAFEYFQTYDWQVQCYIRDNLPGVIGGDYMWYTSSEALVQAIINIIRNSGYNGHIG